MNVDVNFKHTLEIIVSTYSGGSRSTLKFHVRNQTLKNGYLFFEAAPLFNERSLANLKDNDYQSFTFKVLDTTKIALIKNDGWYTEKIGIYLWIYGSKI